MIILLTIATNLFAASEITVILLCTTFLIFAFLEKSIFLGSLFHNYINDSSRILETDGVPIKPKLWYSALKV